MKLLDAVLEKFQYHLQYVAGYGKYFLQILFLLSCLRSTHASSSVSLSENTS